MRAARIAGAQAAPSATIDNTTTARPNTRGSTPGIEYNCDAIARPAAMAPAMPTSPPTISRKPTSPRIIRKTLDGVAPSTMRIPISAVRRLTR